MHFHPLPEINILITRIIPLNKTVQKKMGLNIPTNLESFAARSLHMNEGE